MAKKKVKEIEAEDIEVLAPVVEEVQQDVVLYSTVKQELTKYNTTDEWIALKKSEYKGLIIAGVDDKDGYNVVHSAYMEIKNKLTEVEKVRKSLKQTYSIKPGEIIDEEAKRIKSELEGVRDELFNTRDAIDKEKERIKQEEIKKKALSLQARIVRLLSAGMTKEVDGSFNVKFSDQESDNHTIDAVSVAAYTDQQFEVFASLMEMKASKKKEAEAKLKADQEDELTKLRLENERLKSLVSETSTVEVKVEENSGSISFGVQLEKAIIGQESQLELLNNYIELLLGIYKNIDKEIDEPKPIKKNIKKAKLLIEGKASLQDSIKSLIEFSELM